MSRAMAKRVAIVQSCYIPWKGYFDLINLVDEFILYDDRQYTRRDWRNRNRIKTPQGIAWLTIPVEVKGRYDQRIDETRSATRTGPTGTGRRSRTPTGAAPHFDELPRAARGALPRARRDPRLSAVNRRFLEALRAARDRDAAHLVDRLRGRRGEDRAAGRASAARPARPSTCPGPSARDVPRRERCSRRPGSRSSTWTTPATRSTRSSTRRSSTRSPCSTCSSTPGRRAALHEELRGEASRLSDPILDAVERYYSGRFAEHGPTARGVDWNSRSRRSCASSSC